MRLRAAQSCGAMMQLRRKHSAPFNVQPRHTVCLLVAAGPTFPLALQWASAMHCPRCYKYYQPHAMHRTCCKPEGENWTRRPSSGHRSATAAGRHRVLPPALPHCSAYPSPCTGNMAALQATHSSPPRLRSMASRSGRSRAAASRRQVSGGYVAPAVAPGAAAGRVAGQACFPPHSTLLLMN